MVEAVEDNTSAMVLQKTLADVDGLQIGVSQLVEVTKQSLEIPGMNEKAIQRNYVELCKGIVEKVCENLSSEEATIMLCE